MLKFICWVEYSCIVTLDTFGVQFDFHQPSDMPISVILASYHASRPSSWLICSKHFSCLQRHRMNWKTLCPAISGDPDLQKTHLCVLLSLWWSSTHQGKNKRKCGISTQRKQSVYFQWKWHVTKSSLPWNILTDLMTYVNRENLMCLHAYSLMRAILSSALDYAIFCWKVSSWDLPLFLLPSQISLLYWSHLVISGKLETCPHSLQYGYNHADLPNRVVKMTEIIYFCCSHCCHNINMRVIRLILADWKHTTRRQRNLTNENSRLLNRKPPLMATHIIN